MVGTDIAHAVPLTLVAGIGHASLGHVDWALLAALLVGSLPGIWLGAQLTRSHARATGAHAAVRVARDGRTESDPLTMYQYTDFDRQFVHAARGAIPRPAASATWPANCGDDEFRPLRLQNGWYVQRHAPMLRVAVPYGELSSRAAAPAGAHRARVRPRLRPLHDAPEPAIQLDPAGAQAADVMDLLAEVDMHGIQTSGNCIRNITSDALAGIAPDEVVDPRPYCEILRQWSTLHPEFAFLPRKFKIAVTGAREDRAAIAWHDIGLQLLKNAAGEVGFKVLRRRRHGPHAGDRHR